MSSTFLLVPSSTGPIWGCQDYQQEQQQKHEVLESKKRMSASWTNASILSTSSWANASVWQNDDPSWSNAQVLGGGLTIAEAALEGMSDVGEAIDHLQTLLSLCDGSGSSTPTSPSDTVLEAYEKAFDRNATALAYRMGTPVVHLMNPNKRMEYNFDRLYENVFGRFTKFQKPVQIVSIEPLLRGMIEFIIEVEYVDHCWITFRYHAFTRHGKISRMESIETVVTYDDDEDDSEGEEEKDTPEVENAESDPRQQTDRRPTKESAHVVVELRDETSKMKRQRERNNGTKQQQKRQVNFFPKDRRQQSPYHHVYRPPSSSRRLTTARALLCRSSGAVADDNSSSMCSHMPKY